MVDWMLPTITRFSGQGRTLWRCVTVEKTLKFSYEQRLGKFPNVQRKEQAIKGAYSTIILCHHRRGWARDKFNKVGEVLPRTQPAGGHSTVHN